MFVHKTCTHTRTLTYIIDKIGTYVCVCVCVPIIIIYAYIHVHAQRHVS